MVSSQYLPRLIKAFLYCVIVSCYTELSWSQQTTKKSASKPSVTFAKAEIFRDEKSGALFTLPNGWIDVSKSNSKLLGQVKAVFSNPKSDLIVFLLIENIPGGAIRLDENPLDKYLDGVIKRRLIKNPNFKETQREGVRFAGRLGKRMNAQWQEGDTVFFNAISVCREGYYYFVLSSVCPMPLSRQMISAIPSLERSLTITISAEEQIGRLAKEIAEEMPIFDYEGAKLVIQEMGKRDDLSRDFIYQLNLMIESGVSQLPPSEKSEYKALSDRAFYALNQEKQSRLLKYRDMRDAKSKPSKEQEADAREILREMYGRLSPQYLKRFRELLMKAFLLSLAK